MRAPPGKSEKDIKNLRQEIDILRGLRHENIIQMLDAFETKTDFCVVTGEKACMVGRMGWDANMRGAWAGKPCLGGRYMEMGRMMGIGMELPWGRGGICMGSMHGSAQGGCMGMGGMLGGMGLDLV